MTLRGGVRDSLVHSGCPHKLNILSSNYTVYTLTDMQSGGLCTPPKYRGLFHNGFCRTRLLSAGVYWISVATAAPISLLFCAAVQRSRTWPHVIGFLPYQDYVFSFYCYRWHVYVITLLFNAHCKTCLCASASIRGSALFWRMALKCRLTGTFLSRWQKYLNDYEYLTVACPNVIGNEFFMFSSLV